MLTEDGKGKRGLFPLSDHSSDIIRALEARMREAGVKVHLHAEAAGLLLKDGCAVGIRLSDGAEILGDKVIVACGNCYQATGSTGDGYRFAEEAGHTVTELFPLWYLWRSGRLMQAGCRGWRLKMLVFYGEGARRVCMMSWGTSFYTFRHLTDLWC